MSAAQRAMAMIYPEAPHGSDRKGKKGSSLAPKLEGFSSARLSQARLVLQSARLSGAVDGWPHTVRKTRQGDRIGIDCPNENRRSTICFHVDRLRWRSAESADKMRRSLGSFIKSVRNTQPRRSSNGKGSK